MPIASPQRRRAKSTRAVESHVPEKAPHVARWGRHLAVAGEGRSRSAAARPDFSGAAVKQARRANLERRAPRPRTEALRGEFAPLLRHLNPSETARHRPTLRKPELPTTRGRFVHRPTRLAIAPGTCTTLFPSPALLASSS